MGRNVVAGLTAGFAAWVAAPWVSMARQGTVDSRTREAWTQLPPRPAPAPAPAPVIVPAARVAGIPAPRSAHPSETWDAPEVTIPAARRSPLLEG